MTPRPNGGPAFPRPASPSPSTSMDRAQSGMTLRDYFAAAVLPGLLGPGILTKEILADLAVTAYAVADALIAERSKGGSA